MMMRSCISSLRIVILGLSRVIRSGAISLQCHLKLHRGGYPRLRGIRPVGRQGGKRLQSRAPDGEMLLEPLCEDLGFGVFAQTFRPVLANERQQLRLVLPAAIVLVLA